MTFQAESYSPSGVPIAKDFRDNLIIDRYDPVFADMRASKLKHMRSVNSEDAVTWNVFRSLRQISPSVWLPCLWRLAFPSLERPTDIVATVKLWLSVPPPLGLIAEGDEGSSEVDVAIESATWVWFIEAKYRSDISTGTTTRRDRDQILRNIDVGSYYAGVRKFYFSFLIASATRSPVGVKITQQYADYGLVREKLKSHRQDGLPNLGGVGPLTWNSVSEVLREAATKAEREEERAYASRAFTWLTEKGLSSAV
ncbi:MAG: hypothetical protein M3P26_06710 [Gemmatimonadota bacterium]|nr:hypothetical protein [Gemmatimonadota bacterium]